VSVCGSSLAKAAIFGGDPNWGRIACAAGYSGVQFDQNNLGVQIGSIKLMENGQPLEFDKAAASKYLKDTCAVHGTVNIHVVGGRGPVFRIWVRHTRHRPPQPAIGKQQQQQVLV
jgi:glutamate N-acetyltransferase/amino-acid N-acetyltransferase